MAPSAVLTETVDQHDLEKPSEGDDKTTVFVDYFDAATTSTDQVVRSLIRAGGYIARAMISVEDLAQIERDVRPFLDADRPWAGSYFSPETRRAGGLACRSATFLKAIVQNPLYQEVCTQLVTSRVENWYGDQAFENGSVP